MLHHSLRLSQSDSNLQFGVYALDLIDKGSIVWEFEENEPILSWTSICKLPKNDKENFLKYGFQCGENEFSNPSDISRHFNHSCNPNCAWNSHFQLVAIKDILVSHQATYDYSSNDFDIPFQFECKCQEPNCRLLVSNLDYHLEGVQFFYADEPPAYIIKRHVRIQKVLLDP